MPDFRILTFNVCGLRLPAKRRAIFRFLHVNYPQCIAVIQETHSCSNDVRFWQAEWGSDILFSHGRSIRECGVAILLPRSLRGRANVDFSSDDGRLIIADLALSECHVKIVAAYSPTQGYRQEQIKFFTLLKEKIQLMSDIEKHYLALCGDLNGAFHAK